MSQTNPNGANQFQNDPRQINCWNFYINPESETFANALQSAIRAGYEPKYANQITTTPWFKDRLRRLELLDKAENKLRETLDYEAKTRKGIDSGLLRIQADVSKFLASTLGKDKGYSTRQEMTGKDGDPIEVKVDITKTLEKIYGDDKS